MSSDHTHNLTLHDFDHDGAAKAFDKPLPERKVVEIVNATQFVSLHTPHTSAPRAPGFTG